MEDYLERPIRYAADYFPDCKALRHLDRRKHKQFPNVDGRALDWTSPGRVMDTFGERSEDVLP